MPPDTGKERERMEDQFTRTRWLLGEEAVRRLADARVAVFGIGGVGGYVCEALVRSGVGAFDLIDNDKVSVTNLNRQIIADWDSVGQDKTEVMRRRMLSINPGADVRVHRTFFLPENAGEFSFEEYDYVVDAVDTVTAKIELILQTQRAGVPVISSMGTGNKLDPGAFRVADIYETKACPLARVMRRELKKRGVDHLKVVYSEEEPRKPLKDGAAEGKGGGCGACGSGGEGCSAGREKQAPGSIAFVPPAAGLMIASEVVKDLIGGWM